MKSSATITKVGWVEPSAAQHQDCSNIFHNCYYRDLNKFQVHTKPKPAMCQANTSPLCCSQAKKRSDFDIMSDRLTIISRSGRVFEMVNYWQVLLAHGPLQKSRSLDGTRYDCAIALLAISIARFMVDIHLSYRFTALCSHFQTQLEIKFVQI